VTAGCARAVRDQHGGSITMSIHPHPGATACQQGLCSVLDLTQVQILKKEPGTIDRTYQDLKRLSRKPPS